MALYARHIILRQVPSIGSSRFRHTASFSGRDTHAQDYRLHRSGKQVQRHRQVVAGSVAYYLGTCSIEKRQMYFENHNLKAFKQHRRAQILVSDAYHKFGPFSRFLIESGQRT